MLFAEKKKLHLNVV